MPRASLILKQRHRKKESKSLEKAGLGCALAFSLSILGMILLLVVGYLNLTTDLPALEELPHRLGIANQKFNPPTRLFDRTGEIILLTLENPAAKQRAYLTLDGTQENHLPSVLIDATLAVADPDYWDHPGYTLKNIFDDAHPTIAQRIAFELLEQEPPSLQRNLRERLLAAQLIHKYGHQQVLEWYLNATRYGELIYGADAAARVYFGKPALQLSLPEAAFLVAMAEYPQANAWDAPQVVLERQIDILEAMHHQGRITDGQLRQARQSRLVLQPLTTVENIAPEFARYVLGQLASSFPGEDLERGGWKIVTTLDYDLQTQANCVMQVQFARLQGKPAPQDANLPECQAAKLLPTLPGPGIQSEGLENSAAAVVILDPHTGQILALTGDALTYRPTGSLLTPLIYLTAFTRGFGPASLVWDIPQENASTVLETLKDDYYHGPVRLRNALVNDYLGPAETLLKQFGQEVVLNTARQVGGYPVSSPNQSDEADFHFIRDGELSLLGASQIFGVFAHQGILAGQETQTAPDVISGTPYLPGAVLKVWDNGQNTRLDWTAPLTRPVLSPQLAFVMNHILSDESARWPSLGHPNPLEIGRPAGAKLGFTDDGQNSWAVGYTPQLVVGAWIGKTELTPDRIPVAYTAGLWHAVIQYASHNQTVQTWEQPPGISFIDVCDPSGLLPTPYCPTIVSEVFLSGNEPTQTDYLYQAFKINRETGRLATIFTPIELIDEQVFLVIPPEAAEWARQAGLSTPPDLYDVIAAPPGDPQEAAITSPALFSHIQGEIQFRGTADGDNFQFYRLQVGQGLNPTEWQQIGGDVSNPVRDGVLGTWDTRGLNGLYAVQLLVVQQDQRVRRAVTQVTIDNQAPEIQIVFPEPEMKVEIGAKETLVFQANVVDNLEVQKVEFWLDGSLIATLYKPPYLLAWESKPGRHVFRVTAEDLAGNMHQAEVQFTADEK